jgi:hypothetical protein
VLITPDDAAKKAIGAQLAGPAASCGAKAGRRQSLDLIAAVVEERQRLAPARDHNPDGSPTTDRIPAAGGPAPETLTNGYDSLGNAATQTPPLAAPSSPVPGTPATANSAW